MFTAWRGARTLSAAGGDPAPGSSSSSSSAGGHQAQRLLLAPHPRRGPPELRPSGTTDGRKEEALSLPCPGWQGGDAPVVTPTDRGGCPPSLCGVAVSLPTITADSLITLLRTADDQQCDSDALQSTEFLTVLWFKCYCYFMGALNSNYSLGLLYSLIVATTVLLLLRICSTITDTIE